LAQTLRDMPIVKLAYLSGNISLTQFIVHEIIINV